MRLMKCSGCCKRATHRVAPTMITVFAILFTLQYFLITLLVLLLLMRDHIVAHCRQNYARLFSMNTRSLPLKSTPKPARNAKMPKRAPYPPATYTYCMYTAVQFTRFFASVWGANWVTIGTLTTAWLSLRQIIGAVRKRPGQSLQKALVPLRFAGAASLNIIR